MRTDSLNQFVRLHRELNKERGELETRLRAINEALGAMNLPSSAASSFTGRSLGVSRAPGRRKRGGGGVSLREHVVAVLQQGPKTKEDVLNAVMARGYKFATSNPLNSLGVILYGKNSPFSRADGKFSIKNGATKVSSTSTDAPKRKKRTMSPAARARIAAAQRARWAKQKAGK
jgi:hypothetical protein